MQASRKRSAKAAVLAAVQQTYKQTGRRRYSRDFPAAVTEYALPISITSLSSAEASSNLARFDGVKYGYRAEEVMTASLICTSSTRSEGIWSGSTAPHHAGHITCCPPATMMRTTRRHSCRTARRFAQELATRHSSSVDVIITPVAIRPPAYTTGRKDLRSAADVHAAISARFL